MGRIGARIMVGLAVASLLAGCEGAKATLSPTASAVPTATPHLTPAPSPTAQATEMDRAAEAQRVVEALGGTAPAGVVPQPGTQEYVQGLEWPSVTVGDWTVAWDSNDSLAYVFHHPPVAFPTGDLTSEQAAGAVQSVLHALGLKPGEPDSIVSDADGWSATWGRTEDGIPVDLDGTYVYLNPDGSFREFARIWRLLGTRPADMLTADGAVAGVAACKGAKGSAACQADLRWYQPTDFGLDGDPAAALRLGWFISQSGESYYVVDADTGDVINVP